MRKKIIPLLGIMLACMICNSCKDEKYDINNVDDTMKFDQAMGLPLLYSSVMTVKETLMRYLGGNKLGEYSDHLVYFKYENIKFPIDASAYPLPKILIPKVVSATDPEWVNSGGKWTYTYNELITFPGLTTGEQIDSIVLDEVLHNLTTNNSSVITTVEVDNLKKNGVAFSAIAGSTGKTSSLQGYTMTLQAGNRINMRYIITTTAAAPPASISITNEFKGVDATSTNLDYKYIHGYLGKKTLYNSTMTIPIALFKDVEGMTFEDPKVEIEVANSFGVPINVSFNSLSAKGSTGANIPITINASDTAMVLAYPTNRNTTTLDSTKKTLSASNTSGTIKTAMNSQPSQFTYNIRATMNPSGTVKKDQFIKKDSKLDINLAVVFPLWGFCERYSLKDTIPFDYPELAEKASSMGFKVWFSNGIPAIGTLNMIFLDENNNEVDRVKDISTNADVINIVTSPEIANQRASGTVENTFWLEYPHIAKLATIRKCVISVNFKSAPDGNTVVKVFSTNTLQMKIGVRIKLAYQN